MYIQYKGKSCNVNSKTVLWHHLSILFQYWTSKGNPLWHNSFMSFMVFVEMWLGIFEYLNSRVCSTFSFWFLIIDLVLCLVTKLICRWLGSLSIYPSCKGSYSKSWKQYSEYFLWYFDWQSASSNEVQVLFLDRWYRYTIPRYGFTGTTLLLVHNSQFFQRSIYMMHSCIFVGKGMGQST